MNVDDPAVLNFMRRSMVARLATLSHTGRPSITPLYFVCRPGHIWLGTASWTLAAREVKADPRVCVLFELDQNPNDRRLLRLTGSAVVQTDAQIVRSSDLRAAFKYSLTPGGLCHYLWHWWQLPLRRRYHAQSVSKGPACVIDVTPERFEFLGAEPGG